MEVVEKSKLKKMEPMSGMWDGKDYSCYQSKQALDEVTSLSNSGKELKGESLNYQVSVIWEVP